MRLSITSAVLLAAIAAAAPAEDPFAERERIPYDCSATAGHPLLKAFKEPENTASASAFCSSFIQKTVIRTKRVPATVDGTSTITLDTVTVPGETVTTTQTDTDHTVTVVTGTATVTPFARRDVQPDPPYPDFIPAGKPSGLVKAACKCIVTPPARATVTSTVTEGSTTNIVKTITVDGPTVTKDVVETATVTPTVSVVQNIVCANKGCRKPVPWLSAGGFSSLQACMQACRNLQGCDFILYGSVGGFCPMFSGSVQDVYEPGTSTDPGCATYAFYDKRCDV